MHPEVVDSVVVHPEVEAEDSREEHREVVVVLPEAVDEADTRLYIMNHINANVTSILSIKSSIINDILHLHITLE